MRAVMVMLSIVTVGMTAAGCAVSEKRGQVARSVQATKKHIETHQQEIVAATDDAQVRREANQVDRPWWAGRAHHLAREAILPPALRANVNPTLMSAGE